MSVLIKLRRGTASEWSSANVVLASGEPGYETDTGRFKIGNGSNTWNTLNYSSIVPTGFLSGSGININLGTNGSTAAISVSGLNSSYISDFNEAVDDRIGSGLFISGTGIYLNYNDTANSFEVGTSGVVASVPNTLVLRDSNANFAANDITTNNLSFNTSSGVIEQNIDLAIGEMSWNSDEGTIDYGILANGTNISHHIGQEIFYRVHNETGSTLYAGMAVYASGVHSAGQRISVAPYVADGNIREVRFVGVMSADLSTGQDGYATHFGFVKKLNTEGIISTNYSNASENWVVGDILYVDPTTPGKLTKNEPKHSISVAIVTNVSSNNGRIFVRPTSYGHLNDNHDVSVSGATNGQFLQYNSSTDYWVPSSSGNFTNLTINNNQIITGTGVANHIAYWNSSSGIVADSGQLYWDATNNRLGIVNTTPSYQLDVTGSGHFTQNVLIDGDCIIGPLKAYKFNGNAWGYDRIIFRSDVNNKITSDASGNYNWLVAGRNWTLSDVGNVGIKTGSPTYTLDVVGTGNFSQNLLVNGTPVSVSGHTHTAADITNFNEAVDDRIGSGLFVAGTGINLNYNDGENTFTVSVSGLINNPTNNRILTSRDSTTTGIDAESNLTFDGNLLNVTGSGAFSSNLAINNQTASTIASFDTNKNVVSLSTGTYPSLTELSYVKGVTSAIQTQLNAKQNTLTNPVTGTGVANHIAYWNSSSGIVADSGQLYWDATNNRLGLGTSSPSYTLDVVGTGNFSQNLLVNGTGVSLSGHTHTASDITDFNEAVDDRIGSGLFVAGTGINLSYVDASGSFTVSVTGLINNPGDNRILTSRDSTSTGIDAESGMTFNSNNHFVVGATNSILGGTSSAVVAGINNSISGNNNFIGGGDGNKNYGLFSTITNGFENIASGNAVFSFIGAGLQNKIYGNSSSILGGTSNISSGDYSAILGGQNNNDADYNNVFILGSNITATQANTTYVQNLNVSATGIFAALVVNGTGVSISGHTHTASNITDFNSTVSGLLPVKNISPGSGISVSSTTGNYTISVSGLSSSYISDFNEAVDDRIGSGLFVAGTGIHLNYNDGSNSFTVSATGLISNPANNRILTSRDSTTTGIDAESNATFDGTTLAVSGAITVDNLKLDGNTISSTNSNGNIIIQPSGTGALQRDSGGDARGQYAIDWQANRANSTQVAAGNYGVIGGGGNNIISSAYNYSVIGGGYNNNANGGNCFIGGGSNNAVSSAGGGVICGGSNNTTSSSNAFVGGGKYNSGGGNYSAVCGGTYNDAVGFASHVGGGKYNYAGGNYSVIAGGSYNSSGSSYYHTTISGGKSNSASAIYSTIGGGKSHQASGDYSTVCGGGNSNYGNTASGDHSIVGGGGNNIVSGIYGAILGGQNNSNSGYWSAVGGGLNISINSSSSYAVIAGGKGNQLLTGAGSHCTIGGGLDNKITGSTNTACTIGGGRYNRIPATASIYSTIAGGYNNSISGSSSRNSTISGGQSNSISGTTSQYGTIGGGINNTISGFYSYESIIAGGINNTLSGSYISQSTIGGGSNNSISGQYSSGSTICGGKNNSITGTYSDNSTIGGGYGNTVSGLSNNVVGGGNNNDAAGQYSTISGGLEAKTTRYCENSHAAGKFANKGDAQHTILIARKTTTNNTANQVLFLDDSGERLTLPAETTWTFEIKLSAYNDTDNAAAGWIYRGVIRRNAANSTVLVGSLIEESWKETAMNSASASVVADDTNEALEIRVTGLTSKNIRWVAVVDISQVSYGTP